jgi:SAM-dependent methyltransferase
LKQRKVNFQENASEIIKSDDFLRSIYAEIYSTFFHLAGNDVSLRVLEIGAGGYSPSSALWEHVIVSDIEEHGDPNKGQKIDSANLPFPENSFDLVIAKDALHHFKDPISSLNEIFRVLKSDGKFLVSEPYWSPLGRFVFRFLHPETWDVHANSHIVNSKDPWDGNQAFLFLIQGKWSSLLSECTPKIGLRTHSPTYGISYLLSGGVHTRTKISASLLIRLNTWEQKSRLLQRLFGLNIIASFELK